MSDSTMTVSTESQAMVEKEEPLDLEEGECSDDDDEEVEQSVAPPPPPQPEPQVSPKMSSSVDSGVESRSREERREKKHKRRSRSDSRERHRSKKHKKKKGKDKDRDRVKEKAGKDLEEPADEEEDDVDEEAKKKKSMLKRLKELEGEMGLGDSDSDSSGSDTSNKRKREMMDMQARKKWKGHEPRLCNLFLQGKCPRDESECLFSHDVDVPQVWELCKFYVYERCVKKDKCLYLHKGFPCKFYHLGLDCPATRESCKFSHEPLNDITRGLLLKHVESAPKDLLGDFPRLTRHEAESAIWRAEMMHSGGGVGSRNPRNKSSRWDQMDAGMSVKLAAFTADRQRGSPQGSPLFGQKNLGFGSPSGNSGFGHPPVGGNLGFGQQGSPVFGQGMRSPAAAAGFESSIPPWRAGHSILGSPPQSGGGAKPSGLMDVKLNENEIKKFLSDRKSESAAVTGEDEEPDNGGDETPDVTPPVSPAAGNLEINELPELDEDYQEETEEQIKDFNMEGVTESVTGQAAEEESHDEHQSPPKSKSASKGEKLSLAELSKRMTAAAAAASQGQPAAPPEDPSQPPAPPPEVKAKKDPRLHKVDPRKERLARKEEEERLEREKDQRILDLDLGSVFGDLELPPLMLSPKQTDEERFITNKLGLPFKPHIYHVAKEIDASLNSHPPMEWVLMPLDLPPRDYSDVKHHFSPQQIELDPRLRPLVKPPQPKLKDLPLPSIPLPNTKSDPRLKGRPDPRRKAATGQTSEKRRSSEDADGNKVYNPARELNRERPPPPATTAYPSLPPPPPPEQDQTYSPSDNFKDDQPQYEMVNGGDQEFDFPPNFPFNPGMMFNNSMNHGGGMDPRMMNSFGRGGGGRGGYFQQRFDSGMQGFPSGYGPAAAVAAAGGVNRGQWPGFGRGDLKGAARPDIRGGSNTARKDPRIKS